MKLPCWLIGHRWHETRVNMVKAMWLAHLHSLAGSDAVCLRCGHEWHDFYGFGITPDNEKLLGPARRGPSC